MVRVILVIKAALTAGAASITLVEFAGWAEATTTTSVTDCSCGEQDLVEHCSCFFKQDWSVSLISSSTPAAICRPWLVCLLTNMAVCGALRVNATIANDRLLHLV